MSTPIEEYALLGDCETAALVSRTGSVDWLCWPRFDSGACFAALLGEPEHGRWLLRAADPAVQGRRRYRPDSLILETEYATEDGAATVIDFMPPRGSNSHLVRLVKGTRGRTAMRTELVVRFDYGSQTPWVTRLDEGACCAIAGPDMVVLRTPVTGDGRDFKTGAEFTVRAGETIPFVLTYCPSHLPVPGPLDGLDALAATERFWQDWSSRAEDSDRWSEAVHRSLITLKALTYQPTGGIVAAPTTSLPEKLRGPRNWDYRYCWLRDATFSLLALMNAGYYDEAQAWRAWLLRAAAGNPSQVQIMYGIAGERRLTEWEVPWLPGYDGSKPVRIGNAASEQLQIDIYGELMDALYQGRSGKLAANDAGWSLQRALVDHLATIWHQPDRGIWEVRGTPRHFTYSKVMAWVAVDRAVRSIEKFGLQGPLDRWKALRRDIHEDVCRKSFNAELGAFVRFYGAQDLDASLLLMPLVGFLPPDDPRVRGTVAAIERRLMVDGMVRRYDTRTAGDGLPPGDGAFIPCSFWLVDNLVLQGRREDACRMFERLLSLRNDVGLLSEEYDPHSGRLIGNFPQAFSHIALVSTAHNLTRAMGPARQRMGRNG